MKKLAFLFMILYAVSSGAQDIWEPIVFPDTLHIEVINAEKQGYLFIASGGGYDYYDGLFRSTDNGATWQELELSSFISCLKYNAEGDLFVVSGGEIYQSTDNGDSFVKIYDGPSSPYIRGVNISPEGDIYAFGFADLIRSVDNGITWDTVLVRSTSTFLRDIDFGPDGEIYVVGGTYFSLPGSGFLRSLDHGLTWENIGITDAHLHFIEVNDEGEIIVGGEPGYLRTSENRGETFSYTDIAGVSSIETNSFDDLVLGLSYYTYLGCRLSADWGETTTDLTDEVLNPYVQQVSIAPDNTVYLFSHNHEGYPYQLFKSISPIVKTTSEPVTNELSIFPIPATDKLYINYNHPLSGHYVIFNQLGKEVKNGSLIQQSIDVSDLNQGLYILVTEDKSELIRSKIVVSSE